MASQPDPTQEEDETDQEEDKSERKWKLKDCSMHVGMYGKRAVKDQAMTIDLVFDFEGDPTSKVVELKYTPEELKNAWIHCNNALETVIFLEDCRYKDQKNAFVEFIHQEIKAFQAKLKKQASQNTEGGRPFVAKKTKHFYKPSVELIGEKYYLIAADVFLISGDARKLDRQEVDELPVVISWKGPKYCFETDKKECFELLVKIISDMNSMQNPKFVSFPLASFVAHLSGQLYKHIIRIQGTFFTQLSVSGSAYSTGKSLLQSVNMLIFHGEPQPTTTSMTEATLFETFQEGKNIYVKEFTVKKMSSKNSTIDARFLGEVVKTLWEMSEKRVRNKAYKPDGVIHVDGNILPSDLEPYWTEAMLSKCQFNYTGEDPLDHPQESAVVTRMLETAKEINKFLPVVMALGVECVLPRASDVEIDDLIDEDVLRKVKDRADRRGAQLVTNYDRVYNSIQNFIDEYSLTPPRLFQSETVDRTSLIFFNKEQQDQEKVEEVARQLIQVQKSNQDVYLVERSARSAGFKVKSSDQNYPPALVRGLRHFKSTSSTFENQRGQRVVILSDKDMSDETRDELRALTCRYFKWCVLSAEEVGQAFSAYGNMFYERVEEQMNHLSVSNDGMQDLLNDEFEIEEENNNREAIEDEQADGAVPSEVKSGRGRLRTGKHGKGKDDTGAGGEGGEEVNPIIFKYMCENKYCKDFGKVFQFASEIRRHVKYSYHTEAIAPPEDKN